MTDSIDRKSPLPMPAEVKERLQAHKRKDVTDFADLPIYVRTACAMHELMGMSWGEIAEKLGKSTSTLDKYKKYTAYKTWREELQQVSSDPHTMAEYAIRSNLMGITLEYLAAFQKAIDAGAYTEVAKMAKDLLDRGGIVAKRSGADKAISIKLITAGSEDPVIEAEWEEVE